MRGSEGFPYRVTWGERLGPKVESTENARNLKIRVGKV